jgi:hypothetical protein
MTKTYSAGRAAQARRDGFDKSYSDDGAVSIKCSQCAALVINGVPCHERGCPNIKKERED